MVHSDESQGAARSLAAAFPPRPLTGTNAPDFRATCSTLFISPRTRILGIRGLHFKIHKPHTQMSPGHAAFLTNPQNGSWFTTANPSTTRSTLDVLEPDVPDTGTPKRPAANALLGEGGHPEHPSAPPLRERVRERRSPRGHGFQKPGGAAPCVSLSKHTSSEGLSSAASRPPCATHLTGSCVRARSLFR